MSQQIAYLETQALRNNPAFIKSYTTGMESLAKSGIFSFLRSFARPFLYDGGSDVQRTAAAAAYNAGYHAALDDLIYFKELYLVESSDKKKVTLDFGGRKLALAKGDLLDGDLKK